MIVCMAQSPGAVFECKVGSALGVTLSQYCDIANRHQWHLIEKVDNTLSCRSRGAVLFFTSWNNVIFCFGFIWASVCPVTWQFSVLKCVHIIPYKG